MKNFIFILVLGANLMAEQIILAGGCFWCIEAVYDDVKGVKSAVSGYMGGSFKNPTYKDVSTGKSGHAEVVRLEFDEKEVKLSSLLDIFFAIHDPTTLNRQGADVGEQYRSAIFYTNDSQISIIDDAILRANLIFNNKVITQVSKASKFYEAEDYHQDFYKKNPTHGYCSVVIAPKVDKFKSKFKESVKK